MHVCTYTSKEGFCFGTISKILGILVIVLHRDSGSTIQGHSKQKLSTSGRNVPATSCWNYGSMRGIALTSNAGAITASDLIIVRVIALAQASPLAPWSRRECLKKATFDVPSAFGPSLNLELDLSVKNCTNRTFLQAGQQFFVNHCRLPAALPLVFSDSELSTKRKTINDIQANTFCCQGVARYGHSITGRSKQ